MDILDHVAGTGDIHIVSDGSSEAEAARAAVIAKLIESYSQLGQTCNVFTNDAQSQAYYASKTTDYFRRRDLASTIPPGERANGSPGGIILSWQTRPDFTDVDLLRASRIKKDILVELSRYTGDSSAGIPIGRAAIKFSYLFTRDTKEKNPKRGDGPKNISRRQLARVISGVWQGAISRGDLHVVTDASKEAEEMRAALASALPNTLADLGVSCDILDNNEIAREYFSQRVTDYFERRRLVKEYLGKGPYTGEIGGVIIFWSDPPDFTAPSGELDAAQKLRI